MQQTQIQQSLVTDKMTEVTIEEIIDLIRNRESTDVMYHSKPGNNPNVIVLICGDKYCTDIREFKPILTTHSNAQVYIRSHDKENKIYEWKEYYIPNPSIFITFIFNEDIRTKEQKVMDNVFRC